MILKEETLSYYEEIQGYRKTFDNSGRLIKEHNYSPIIGNEETTYHYDDKGRLLRNVTISSTLSGVKDIRVKKINYKTEDSKVITYSRLKNKKCFDDLTSNQESWKEVGELHKVETLNYRNDLLIYKHTQNNDRNSVTIEEYLYDINNNCTKFIKNDQLKYSREYDYNTSNLISTVNEYKYYDNERYLAFSEKHFYDKNNNRERTEKWGLYNSKMYLYEIIELEKNEDFSTESRKIFQNFNSFLGYYDYDSMVKENKDNFQLDFLNVNTFENRKFDVNIVKKFDLNNDLIETYYIDSDTGKISDKKIFIHDYINDGFKNFELCLKIEKNCSVEKNYIRKFIY